MDDVIIARAVHVVSVVLWIGGVGFVTTVLLPAVRGLKAPNERMEFFDQIERRFAWQSRIWTAIAGLTGFYMLYRFHLGDRLRDGAYWWVEFTIFFISPFTRMIHIWSGAGALAYLFRPYQIVRTPRTRAKVPVRS